MQENPLKEYVGYIEKKYQNDNFALAKELFEIKNKLLKSDFGLHPILKILEKESDEKIRKFIVENLLKIRTEESFKTLINILEFDKMYL